MPQYAARGFLYAFGLCGGSRGPPFPPRSGAAPSSKRFGPGTGNRYSNRSRASWSPIQAWPVSNSAAWVKVRCLSCGGEYGLPDDTSMRSLTEYVGDPEKSWLPVRFCYEIRTVSHACAPSDQGVLRTRPKSRTQTTGISPQQRSVLSELFISFT